MPDNKKKFSSDSCYCVVKCISFLGFLEMPIDTEIFL